MVTPTPPDNVPTPLNSQFDSGIIKALLTAMGSLVAAVLTVFTQTDTVQFMSHWELVSGALVAFVAIAAPIGYAWWSRVRQATPPISQSAIDATVKREVALKKSGDSTPGVMPKEEAQK